MSIFSHANRRFVALAFCSWLGDDGLDRIWSLLLNVSSKQLCAAAVIVNLFRGWEGWGGVEVGGNVTHSSENVFCYRESLLMVNQAVE